MKTLARWMIVWLGTAMAASGCNGTGTAPSSAQSTLTTTTPPTSPAPSPTPTPTPTPTSTPTPSPSSSISLGLDADMGGYRPFPATNPWNQDVSQLPLNANSATYVNSIGATAMSHAEFGTTWMGTPNGIPYFVVPGTQPKVTIHFQAFASESDPGPYPIPADPSVIEAGSDHHVIVVDRDNLKLYELYNASLNSDGSWNADSGAIFDLTNPVDRPLHWTSADAAGLPIYPGLVRYDEVMVRGVINHAIRFTAASTQNGFIYPARHAAGTNDATLPPMGLRMRLKASYDISWASKPVQIILTALKKYGMILADNGANWALAGAPDPRWNDTDLHDLASVPGSAFEAVQTGAIQN